MGCINPLKWRFIIGFPTLSVGIHGGFKANKRGGGTTLHLRCWNPPGWFSRNHKTPGHLRTRCTKFSNHVVALRMLQDVAKGCSLGQKQHYTFIGRILSRVYDLMYTHIYIYIHTYIHYIHTYIHTLHTYIHTYIHTLHTNIHVYTCVYIYTYIHTNIHVYTCVYTYIYIYYSIYGIWDIL